jgi:N-acetylglucosamine kinase-like BadF-type ATPase
MLGPAAIAETLFLVKSLLTVLFRVAGQLNADAAHDLLAQVTPVGSSRERIVHEDLVIGIDGGGTSTIALLGLRSTGEILARGSAGASNIQAVGVEAGLKALDDALERAFLSLGRKRGVVASACLGLAGIDRNEGLAIIHGWAKRVDLAGTVSVANDATLLLAAGTPEGWGLAVIAGTGSIAFVKTAEGTMGRCGGWGHLLGDEGSAYRIAVNALQAVCRAYDGVGPQTILLERFLKAMRLADAPELIPAVYRGAWDRTAIAGLAPVVMQAAIDGDALARQIVQKEARELALTAAGAVVAHGLPRVALPVALAGGVLTQSEIYREEFLGGLLDQGISVGTVKLVTEPAEGAIVLANRALNSPQA